MGQRLLAALAVTGISVVIDATTMAERHASVMTARIRHMNCTAGTPRVAMTFTPSPELAATNYLQA
jgi:hypothetical protein